MLTWAMSLATPDAARLFGVLLFVVGATVYAIEPSWPMRSSRLSMARVAMVVAEAIALPLLMAVACCVVAVLHFAA